MISAPDRAGLLAPSRSAAARIARPVLSSELVEGVGKVLKVQARGTTDAGKLLGRPALDLYHSAGAAQV